MKKIYLLLLACLMLTAKLFATDEVFAVGPNSAGTQYGGAYALDHIVLNIKAVADYVNGHSLPVGITRFVFEIQDDYNESAAPQIEFKSTMPVLIRPRTGGTTNIWTRGNPGGSTPMIFLNGAKNIVFDGRPGSSGTTSRWKIENQTSGGGAQSATFLFENGATNNTLQYLQVISTPILANDGIIAFGIGGSTGNSNNIIDHNEIATAGGGGNNAIYSKGTTGKENSANTISNNNIHDFAQKGIWLEDTGNGNGWIIQSNSFYATSPVVNPITCILINGGTAHNISYNHIGGSAPGRQGPTLNAAADILFTGIELNGTTQSTFVQYNYIGNITAGLSGLDDAFIGIAVGRSATASATVYSNYIGYAGGVTDIIHSNGNGCGILIDAFASGSGMLVQQNYIYQILMESNDVSASLFGILMMGTGSYNIYGNVTGFLKTVDSKNTNPENACVAYMSSGTGTYIFTANQIYQLNNSSTIDKTPVTQYAVRNGNVTIKQAYGYGTYTANGKTGTNAGRNFAIYHTGGVLKAYNNYFSFGDNSTDNLYGIYSNANTAGSEYVYNSFYLYGTSPAASYAYGFYKPVAETIGGYVLKNNIFYIDRKGSVSQYGVYFEKDAEASASSIGHNLYVLNNISNTFHQEAGDVSFQTWTSTGPEKYSYAETSTSIQPLEIFNNPQYSDLSIVNTNPKCWSVNGKGQALSGYSDDYALNVRKTSVALGCTDIGANEFTPAGGATTPPDAVISGTRVVDGTEIISVGNRRVAVITWGPTTIFPTSLTAKYYTGVQPPSPPTTQSGQTAEIMNCYWDISASGGSNYSYDIKTYFDPSMVSNVGLDANVQLIKNSGTATPPWEARSATVRNYTENSMKITGETSFSLFAIADATTVVLPVTLEYFNAAKNNNDVVVKWKSVMELDHKSYEAQRSFDGKNFSSFKTVLPSSLKEYTVTDADALNKYAGKIFYRLKMISIADAIAYSAVAVIDNTNAKTQAIKMVSENPFTDHIDLQFNNEKQNKTNIMLYDAAGKLMGTRSTVLPAGNSSVRLENLGKLSSAAYVLRVSTETGGMSMQVMKK